MFTESYGHTDVGPVRTRNEDIMLVDKEAGIFVVADGMGGHAAGDVASALAVDALHRVLINQPTDPDETHLIAEIDPNDHAEQLRERLRYGMNQASAAIRRTVERDYTKHGMGTTIVALLVDASLVHVAHVGDSRAYLFRNGELTLLTRDHTVVQQEVDAGRLTPELARTVPHKHILTQSVGGQGSVEPDVSSHPIRDGDLFVLCSDGLTDVLTDDTIAFTVTHSPIDELAPKLVKIAATRGTTDNITVVVVKFSEEPD